MRFSKLHLARFGMFTDEEIDLSPDGINLIVGSNEAGKSTTRAAVTQFLYGIPARSSHDWIHKYPDLRIGATVLDASGAERELYRVKKAAPSLRDPNGVVVDDDVLRVLLSGVSEDLFGQLFSMSHDEISSGGESLLSNGGEVGVALFGAGSGLTTLNQVLGSLAARAEALFKPSASRPSINAEASRFKELQGAVKEASQSAAEVEKLEKLLAKTRRERVERDALLNAALSALVKVERVRRSRGKVLARQKEVGQLQDLVTSGPRVDSSIPESFDSAAAKRSEANIAASGLQADIDGLTAQLDALSVDAALLGEATTIEALTKEISGLSQNFEDLPGLQRKVGDLERDLEELLRRVPPDCALTSEGLPSFSDVEIARLRRLVTERSVIDPQFETQTRTRAESHRKAAEALASLEGIAAPSDTALLAAAIGRVRLEGALEVQRDQQLAEAKLQEAEVSATLSSVGLAVAARQADGVPLPDTGRVSELDTEVAKAQLALNAANDKRAEIAEERLTVRTELDALIRDVAPPSAAELDAERAQRDRGWQLVRNAWLGPAAPDEEQQWTLGKPLHEAYEAAVASADSVVDRMVGDASAVERRASLERRFERLSAELDLADGDVATKASGVEVAQAEWSQLWLRLELEPSDRKAMDLLMSKCAAAADGARALRKADARIAQLTASIETAKADIDLALRELGDDPAPGLSLVALLERGEQRCKAEAELVSQRSLLELAVDSAVKAEDDANTKLVEVTTKLEKWKTEWEDALKPLGLAPATDIRDIEALLDTLGGIVPTHRALGDNRRRVVGIERRNSLVAGQIDGVLARLAHLDIRAESSVARIEDLKQRLADAKAGQVEQQTLLTQVDQKRSKLADQTARLAEARASIQQLVDDASMPDEDRLRDAVDRTKAVLQHEEAIAALEKDLLDLAEVPIAQIEAEVIEFADVDLDARIADLAARRDEHDNLRRELDLSIGGLEDQLRKIDESSKAALAAAESQEVLASLSAHAEEYIRVTLAKHLLEQEIESYRERNQGPILSRASELFGRLTLGRYSSIDTDIGARGATVLQARTQKGSLTEVGSLSTGARDQLYLALRLAALEHVAAAGRAVPVLLDDLFVHFDDDRTQAGLKVLDELSSTVQVLLFTHHERVAEQAAKVIDPERLNVQRLGVGR